MKIYVSPDPAHRMDAVGHGQYRPTSRLSGGQEVAYKSVGLYSLNDQNDRPHC